MLENSYVSNFSYLVEIMVIISCYTSRCIKAASTSFPSDCGR